MTSGPRTGRFLVVWTRVVAVAAARRALPVWVGVAILAGVLFGGTGMHPSALTRPALRSWRFGAGLTATWLVLVMPAGRAMLDPRLTAYLRALPVARWRRGLVTAAIAVAVQGPWALLWGLGEGGAVAVGVVAATAAAMLAVAAGADRIRWPHRPPRWRGGVAALIGAHRRMLVRGRGAALIRATGVAWLGGAAAGMVTRANQLHPDEAVWWGLVVASAALPIAVGALAGPVVDGDRRLGWLLRASGCSWPARVLASGLVLAGLGAGLGAVTAAASWSVGGATASTVLALGAWLAVLGAGLGGLALRAGAWAAAHDDGDRVVVGMAGAGIAAFVAIGVLGPAGALAVAVGGGAAAAALASRRAEAA